MNQNDNQHIDLIDENIRLGNLPRSKGTKFTRGNAKTAARKVTQNFQGNENLKDFGKGFVSLVNELQTSKAELEKELSYVRGQFKKEGGKNSNKIMNAAFFNKTGVWPNKRNLEYLAQIAYAATQQTVSHDKLKELVILDDVPMWLKKGLAGIVKAGSMVGTTLLPAAGGALTFASNLADKWADGVNYKAEVATQPVEQRINGVNIELDKTTFKPDKVSIKSVLGVIGADTLEKHVVRFDDVQPGALYQTFHEINVTPSTANGSAFVEITNSEISGTTPGMYITYTTSGTDFNPATGAYTTGTTTMANPALSSSVNALRRVSVVATFKPSLNGSTSYSNGRCEVIHNPAFDGSTSDFATPCSWFTQTNMGSQPFYQSGGITQQFTQLYYNPLDSVPYTPVVGGTRAKAPIIFLFTGCNTAGAQVGVVTVHVVWNVIPSVTGLNQLVIQNPEIGPFTPDLMDAIYQICPQLFIADTEHRLEIMKGLKGIEPLYENVLRYLAGFTWKKNFSKPGGFVN